MRRDVQFICSHKPAPRTCFLIALSIIIVFIFILRAGRKISLLRLLHNSRREKTYKSSLPSVEIKFLVIAMFFFHYPASQPASQPEKDCRVVGDGALKLIVIAMFFFHYPPSQPEKDCRVVGDGALKLNMMDGWMRPKHFASASAVGREEERGRDWHIRNFDYAS